MRGPVRRRGLAALVALLCAGLVVAPAGAVDLDEPLLTGPPPRDWPAPTSDEVGATSWILVEGATGQRLAEFDADVPRPVASTVKVLTALVVAEHADLDEEITVGNEVRVGGASAGLEPGDVVVVGDLVTAILVRSGNDAAEALAVHVGGDQATFLEMMGAQAEELGLEPRTFVSPSGLDDANRLTARELAVIGRAALAHPELRPLLAMEEFALGDREPEPNRNELLQRYAGTTGVKTGFTLAAGHSLIASAERDGRELVAVVLDAGDDPARFDQAAALLELGFVGYERHEVSTTLDLAVAGGWWSYETDQAVVTTPADRPPRLAFRPPARPPQDAISVAIEAGELSLTTLEAAADAQQPTSPPEGTARVGHALVDGAYASLRAAARVGALR